MLLHKEVKQILLKKKTFPPSFNEFYALDFWINQIKKLLIPLDNKVKMKM